MASTTRQAVRVTAATACGMALSLTLLAALGGVIDPATVATTAGVWAVAWWAMWRRERRRARSPGA